MAAVLRRVASVSNHEVSNHEERSTQRDCLGFSCLRYSAWFNGFFSLRLMLVMICAWMPFSVTAQDAPPSPEPPVENRFGIVEGMWFPELACDLGVGWERLIFDWSAHQPESADDFFPFFNIPDDWLRNASACGREVVAVVKNTPQWATDGPPGAGLPRGIDLPVDDPDNVWASFMRRVAGYYASRGVHRFIIWNEPDIAPGTYGFEFDGTLEDYVRLVKVAYLAAKQGNPQAEIHLAGTTYWHDVNSGERLYTDRLLEAIAADPDAPEHGYYFDALSLHIYFRTDTVYDIVRVYADLLEKHGLGEKSVWITETNASPNLDPDWPVTRPQFQISLDQQAAFVVQSAALGLAAGAERIAVYKLYDQFLPEGGESFGLLFPADSMPRPGFYAWQNVIERFADVITADLTRHQNASIVRMHQTADRVTLAVWSRVGITQTLTVSATSDKAYVFDQLGNAQIIRPQNGVYTLTLPGAICEIDGEGCVVGGAVSIFVQPAGDVQLAILLDGESVPLAFGEGSQDSVLTR